MAISALGAGAIQAGATTLSSLASRIFGSGDRDKIRRFAEFLQSQIGQDAFSSQDQERLIQNILASMRPGQTRRAEGIAKRLGLESGVAQGELARFGQADEFRARADIGQLAEKLNLQRDIAYAGQAGQLFGSLA